MAGEVAGQRFTRCAQSDPPSARKVRLGGLQLTLDARVLSIERASTLRIAAFTGPVGAALERSDLELLTRAHPELLLFVGGLGDDQATAQKNLASLAALHVPCLFVAGGADRLPVFEAAFAGLPEGERDLLLNATGLRELRIGSDRFVLVAGAPFGRYALDDSSCGLTGDDFEEIQAAALAQPPATRTWLLSWHAPAGVLTGAGGSELGSPDLQALSTALGAVGGLYAYPEGLVDAARPGSVWLLPRLSRVGSLREDGSRLHSQVLSLLLTDQGLAAAP